MRRVSVCIPTYERPNTLNMALAGLLGHTGRDRAFDELILAVTGPAEASVNGQTHACLDGLRQDGVHVTVLDEMSGVIDAKLQMAERAKNDVLLFLDDDAVLSRSYFDMARSFARPDVGMVSGVLQCPTDVGYFEWSAEPQHVPQSVMRTNRIEVADGKVLFKDKWQVYMWSNPRSIRADFLLGTALFVRKHLAKLWDLDLQVGACAGEEVDASLSATELGYQLWLEPQHVAWHLYAPTGGFRHAKRSLDLRNWQRIMHKHKLGVVTENPAAVAGLEG